MWLASCYCSVLITRVVHNLVHRGLAMRCHLTGYTGNLRYSNTADKVQILFDMFPMLWAVVSPQMSIAAVYLYPSTLNHTHCRLFHHCPYHWQYFLSPTGSCLQRRSFYCNMRKFVYKKNVKATWKKSTNVDNLNPVWNPSPHKFHKWRVWFEIVTLHHTM